VGFSVFLCGSGLILLWLRPSTSTKVKATVSSAVGAALVMGIVLSAGSSPDRAGNTANQFPSTPATESAATEGVVEPWLSIPAWARIQLVEGDSAASFRPYVATVVGFGDPDSFTKKDNISWVQLAWTREWLKSYSGTNEVAREDRTDAVRLDMVMPFVPGSCGGSDRNAELEARGALERLLPIGSTVLAIRGGEDARAEDRFLHVLATPESIPDPPPPAGSVNEALVATGTWVPDGTRYYYDDRPFDAQSVSSSIIGPKFQAPEPITQYDPSAVYFKPNDYGRKYSDRIIEAANEALRSTTPGLACRDAYSAYVENEVKQAKKDDREFREWQAEMERQRESWTCRDGDGDGICFER